MPDVSPADASGRDRAAFSAHGVINRFDYNLKWNNLIEGGGFVVAPEVELILALQGVRPAAAAPARK